MEHKTSPEDVVTFFKDAAAKSVLQAPLSIIYSSMAATIIVIDMHRYGWITCIFLGNVNFCLAVFYALYVAPSQTLGDSWSVSLLGFALACSKRKEHQTFCAQLISRSLEYEKCSLLTSPCRSNVAFILQVLDVHARALSAPGRLTCFRANYGNGPRGTMGLPLRIRG